MKKITKYFMAAVLMMATVSLTGCKKDDEKKTDGPSETTESTLYAFQFNGETVAAGATVQFHPSFQQITNDMAQVDFFMVNKTEQDQESVLKIELVSGPAALSHEVEICYSGACRQFALPWTSEALTLVPGVNTALKMTLDYMPSVVTEKTVYCITLGKGTAMENPQVMYLEVTAE